MEEKELTVEVIAEMAVKKAGSRRSAAKAAGISRTALDSLLDGSRKPWNRTVQKLVKYALCDQPEEKPKA